MFKVKKECCNQCLFSKDKIVSNKRRQEILKGCRESDNHFICHKASIEGKDVCCRSFFDTQTSNLMSIAGRLNAIEFVA